MFGSVVMIFATAENLIGQFNMTSGCHNVSDKKAVETTKYCVLTALYVTQIKFFTRLKAHFYHFGMIISF